MKATRCSMDGCDGAARTRGMCNSHYNAMLRCGQIAPLPHPSLAERFARRLEVTPSGCIEWTGSRNRAGYGSISVGGRTEGRRSTHRLAWELTNGSIPDGMQILHHCDNPPCCNPAHLFLGTRSENMADMISKGRSQGQKKTECSHGHPFDEANTRITALGTRSCRKCGIAATARWAERRASLGKAA